MLSFIICGVVAAVPLTIWFFFFAQASDSAKTIRSVPKRDARAIRGETIPRCNPKTASRGIIRFPEDSVQTGFDVIEVACKRYPNHPCLGVRPLIRKHTEDKVVDGRSKVFEYLELGPFNWITYKQVRERALNFGCGLLALGLKHKGFLAIFEETRLEWTLAKLGSFSQSVTIFTVYSNLGEEALAYALAQGEITHIVTNANSLKTIAKIKKSSAASLEHAIFTDAASPDAISACTEAGIKTIAFEDVEKLGAKNQVPPTPPKSEDVACIMYTSGSTGPPKGVMTTHGNIVGMIAAIKYTYDFKDTDSVLHYLPLAHSMCFSAESTVMYFGVRLGYGSPRTLVPAGVKNCNTDLKELSPTLLIAVPTIFERIMHGVNAMVKKESAFTQKIFNFALDQAIYSIRNGTRSRPLWGLVFKKVRRNLGLSNVRLMLTGSAPLSGKVHDWVRAVFGQPLVQGYGLTETNSAGFLQTTDDLNNEQVGSPVPCSECKLVDVPDMGYFSTDVPSPRGEIYLRGSTITKGYFKDPARTKEAYFEDGEFTWFATGDIGAFLPTGALKIIDRKKNLVKPPHGEYIAIEKLESCYKNCPWLSFTMVYADGFHFDCVILGVPNRLLVVPWAQENKIPNADDWSKLCAEKKVREKVLAEVQKVARDLKLKSIEVIKNVWLLPDDWTPDNQMLTVAMKLNRTYVVKAYKSAIDTMYDELESKKNAE